MTKFLKEKNVDVKTFKSYFGTIQLKKVNNAIKHSDDYETSLTDVQEFKNSDKITYEKLDHFYNRIKEMPSLFLQELISAIYDELYSFTDAKIDGIAKSFALRMKKADAIKLTAKIN